MVDKHKDQLSKLGYSAGDNYILMQEIIIILLTNQSSICHQVSTVLLR